MRKLVKSTTLYILFFLVSFFLKAQDITYGLEFNSYEVIKERRTSLHLTPDKEFFFSEGFSMSFDVCFKSDFRFSYGNIFRIIGENQQYIDFIIKEKEITVVDSQGKIIVDCSFEDISYFYDMYLPFKIRLDIKNNLVNVLLGEKNYSKNIVLEAFKKTAVYFGRCDYPKLHVNDIPRMIIRDIRINKLTEENIYYWPLLKHSQEGVYDELNNNFAFVDNPSWLIDGHVYWKKQASFNTKNNPQIAYNSDKDQIVIFDYNKLYSYQTSSHVLTDDTINNISNYIYTNQIVYNPYTGTYNYYVDPGKDVIAYDTIRRSWPYSNALSDYYSHHNKFISSVDSCLYLFGGYGHHRYQNAINKYDYKTQSWEVISYKGDQISPRYLSGLGVINKDNVLIFGGYGSETGAQEIAPQYYYDLYIFNNRKMEVQKVWELTSPDFNFIVANSLVVDTINNCFYALCFSQSSFNTSLFLARFSLERPEYEILGDNISFDFQDINSYADLFLNEENDELFAVTYSPIVSDSMGVLPVGNSNENSDWYVSKNPEALVSIYSLSFPPLKASDLFQQKSRGINKAIFILIVFLFLCLLFYILKIKKNKEKAIKKKPTQSLDEESFSTISSPVETAGVELIQKPGVYLFEYFKIVDKSQNDISGEFSPLLKELFLLILFNSFKNPGKGISSAEIKEILWFDKSKESAKNNMAVLLSKLRSIFKRVGHIEIRSRNSYWAITFGDDIICDYQEAFQLVRFLKERKNRTKQNIQTLLSIISKGALLPVFQFDWLDSFKADFSNELVDLLSDIINQPDMKIPDSEYVNIANTIFIYDSLNEDALRLKCNILIKMGKNSLAKGIYTQFTKEYFLSLGIPYKCTFEQLVF